MKIIYIAGKYGAKTEWGLIENIRHAEDIARKLWLEGWAVICPHKNTAHFGGLWYSNGKDSEKFLTGDLEILKRCDAIYMMKDWRWSKGAKMEHNLAEQLGLEVYYEQ